MDSVQLNRRLEVDYEQRTALDGSIRKWERIVKELDSKDPILKVSEKGPSDCECCISFRSYHIGCTRCPIYEFTGKHDCMNTPYQDWANRFWPMARRFVENGEVTATEEEVTGLRTAASRELEFLYMVRDTPLTGFRKIKSVIRSFLKRFLWTYNS